MTRKITLKNDKETIVIENESMEVIVKVLIDKYSVRTDRSGFEIVIIYTTKYILDYSEFDEDEIQLFVEVLHKLLTERDGECATIIHTYMKEAYYPIVARIN